jgi:hypothetical protein
MLIPHHIVQREDEVVERQGAGRGPERIVIYRAGRWYRACIVRRDGMGWDGEGTDVMDALRNALWVRNRARKTGY